MVMSEPMSTATAKEEGPTVERLSVDLNTVPRYFDKNGLCAQDLIAYVRHKDRYPNPNQIVILETESTPVDMERLKDNKIYYGGPHGNAKEVNIYVGSLDISLPVFVEDMDPESHSCGLDEICERMAMDYNIDNFGLLLCGGKEHSELLTKAWEYMTRISPHGCIVPDFILEAAAKDKAAIDIAPVVAKLNSLLLQNKLTHTAMMKEVDALAQQVKAKLSAGDEVRIMSSDRVHDKYTRQIMLYLSVHCGISPKYLESYLDSYIEGRVAYDYKRMSLYERFMWLKNLPDAFGYINKRLSFYCFCSLEDEGLFASSKAADTMEIALPNGNQRKLSKEIAARIYPVPLYVAYVDSATSDSVVFKPEEGTGNPELDAKLKRYLDIFNYVNYGDALNFLDFRVLFKGSPTYFTGEGHIDAGSSVLATTDDPGSYDAKIDLQWTKIFVDIAREVKAKFGEDIYPSIKNSILLPVSQTGLLLLYCPGSLGINCMMKSNYFDKDIQIIGEESFHQLIDIRTLLALISKEPATNDADADKGKKRFDLVMSKRYSNLTPWVSEEVILTLNTLQPYHSELSYYDRFLRGTVNILPIVTDRDDKLFEEKYMVLLERMSYVDIMSADLSNGPLQGINCFGTSTNDIDLKPAVQVTIECAKGDAFIWQNL